MEKPQKTAYSFKECCRWLEEHYGVGNHQKFWSQMTIPESDEHVVTLSRDALRSMPDGDDLLYVYSLYLLEFGDENGEVVLWV